MSDKRNLKRYKIPNASNYEVDEDSKVYRLLKSGGRKPIKTQLFQRHKGKENCWRKQSRVSLSCDDGKRRCLSPLKLLREAQILAGEDHPWLEKRHREIGSQFIEIPDLWCLYSVDHGGNVMHLLEDAQGTYFKEVNYYMDNSRSAPLERINLRDVSFRPRTYTRKKLKEMHEQRMQELMEMHE